MQRYDRIVEPGSTEQRKKMREKLVHRELLCKIPLVVRTLIKSGLVVRPVTRIPCEAHFGGTLSENKCLHSTEM